MKQLQLKDICCYLPYGLKIKYEEEDTIWIINPLAYETDYDKGELQLFHALSAQAKPLLRPMSMLYQTIVHEGKEEAPIIELAKIALPETINIEQQLPCGSLNWPIAICDYKNSTVEFYWDDKGCFIADGWETGMLDINQWKLTDWLSSRLFDFRALIGKGLAIKMET